MVILYSLWIRKPQIDEGFKVSDATYHVLLTLQTYDDSPVYIHHFLPIQTFSGSDNKFIKNGPSLLQDKLGNNFYVSFSPIGFFVPYVFCKIFHLGLTINSLYIFNCLLMIISAILLWKIIFELFKDIYIASTMALLYMFIPEVMYTQGIVYWHHSLSQIFLFTQMLMFLRIFLRGNKKRINWVIFWIVSFLYPYTEWTGFVCNMGLTIAIILLNTSIIQGKSEKLITLNIHCLTSVLGLVVVTFAALLYYIWRFTAVASISQIIPMLTARADARHEATLSQLVQGYWASYWNVLIIFACISLFLLLSRNRKKIFMYFKNKTALIWLFAISFPLVENLILEQHAIIYTFDRLKMALPLLCVIALCLKLISKNLSSTLITQLIIVIFVIGCGIGAYNNHNIKKLKNYTGTMKVKEYLDTNFLSQNNTILVKEGWRAWGYLQTLYKRNIYCTALYSDDNLYKEAKSRGKRYIVYLNATEAVGDTSCYSQAKVFDVNNHTMMQINFVNGDIKTREITSISAANLTDKNWTNGILNTNPKEILFNNHPFTLNKLKNAKKIYCDGLEYDITHLDYDDRWIHINTDKDAKKCMYPTLIKFE